MPSLGELRIDLIANIAQFVSPFNKATSQLERFALTAERALDKVEKSLEKAGSKLTLKITAPLALLARESIKAADAGGFFADSMERLGLQARAALEPLGRTLIKTFEEFRPAVEDGIKFVYGLGAAFEELEPATKRQIVVLAGLAASLGPVLLGASAVVTIAKLATKQLAAVVGVVGDVSSKLANLPKTLEGIASSVKVAAGGMKQLALAAAAVAIAFAAFELGKGLYDQFKIIQEGLAGLVRANDITWSFIREIWRKGVTYISGVLEGLWDGVKFGAGKAIQEIGTDMAAVGALIHNEFGQTLMEMGLQISALGDDWVKAKPPENWFDYNKLLPLRRLANEAEDLAEKLGPVAAKKVNDAWARIVLIPKVEGLGAPLKSLPGISDSVDQIVESLKASGNASFEGLAKALSDRRDELFKSIGDLPADLQRQLITRQEAAARDFARETYKVTIDSIDKEFAGKATKGEGFWGRIGDRMKADLMSVRDSLADLPGTITDAVTGSGGGLMGLVDLLTRARTIAKDVKLPQVVTKRDLEDLERYSKEMTDLKDLAIKFQIEAHPEQGFSDAVKQLEDLRQKFPENIDNITFAKQMDKIKHQFEEVLPVGQRVAQGLGDAFKGAAGQISDRFADLVIDGKAKLGDLARSIAKTFVSIAANKAIFGPLADAFGEGVKSYFASGVGTSPTGQVGPIAPGKARGGIFMAGHEIAFAAGGVVNGATHFGMAGGGVGLMGEAGPEAIMPLQRINGYLGVRSAGGGTVVNVIDQRRGGEKPAVSEQTGPDGRKQISILIRDEMKSALADGSLDRSLGSNFGLGRRGARR